MTVTVEPATAADANAVLQLLAANALLLDGLVDHLDTTLVARAEGRIVGCAALELHADGALLRSVAVDPAARSAGVGARLTSSALDLARQRGRPDVYLLTKTAGDYFPRFGFERIARGAVPPGVLASVEFRTECCASAIVMRRHLDPPAAR